MSAGIRGGDAGNATLQDNRDACLPAMTTPDGPFWELVKAEVRATWFGRWRWLWAGILLANMVLAALPSHSLDRVFAAISTVFHWSFVVLGSDLASTRFASNPEPFRQWAPRALFARAAGRLLPVLAASVVIWAAACPQALAQW